MKAKVVTPSEDRSTTTSNNGGDKTKKTVVPFPGTKMEMSEPGLKKTQDSMKLATKTTSKS